MIQGVCAAHLQVSARVSARAVAEMRRYLDQASRPSGRFHPVTPATAAKVREAGQATGQQAREKGDEQTPTPGAAPGLRPPRRRSGRKRQASWTAYLAAAAQSSISAVAIQP